jgi:hypothetical protein
MSWVFVSVGLAAGADWRRLSLLALALAFPAAAIAVLGVHWWRQRLPVSMRGAGFCDAVSSEMRAGASFRFAVTTAARSVEADVVHGLCRTGAPMTTVAAAARLEFPEIGDELSSLLARSEGMGVSPAALFDEIGTLALAQAEVAREVATASAPAKATGAVLLLAPLAAIVSTAGRGGFDLYLAQSSQRAAASLGALLVTIGLGATLFILRRAR